MSFLNNWGDFEASLSKSESELLEYGHKTWTTALTRDNFNMAFYHMQTTLPFSSD